MNGRRLRQLFTILLLLTLAKYVLLAGFAHPVADDFCYAAKSAGMSLWDWSLSEWMYWNGRYASNLLMIHGPLTWHPHMLAGYRLVPLLLLGATFLGVFFLLHRASGASLTASRKLLATLIFLLLYLNLMPDLGEGFFWYTGAITYQLGSILLLFHLALLLPPADGRNGLPAMLLGLALAVAVVGMDEIHMLLMVGFHAVRVVWLAYHRKPLGRAALFLAAVIGGALLMGLAPGNAVRGSMFADTHEFWRSLGMSFLQSFRFIGSWLLSPSLLLVGLLFMPLHGKLRETLPLYRGLLRFPPWLALAIPFLLVMASSFPAYWSTGLLGQHRTVNVACLLSLPFFFLNLAIALEKGPLRTWVHWQPSTRQKLMTMALLIVACNTTRNDLHLHDDLWSGRLAAYDQAMLQRERQMRDAAGNPEGQVTFIRLAAPPRSLATYELNGPLRDWMMQCEARYFGVGESRVSMTEAPKP